MTDEDLTLIVGRVRASFDATAIYLFGSQAKGSAKSGSDIDLLVVGPSRLPQGRRGREVVVALATFPSHFDVLFYTEAELDEACADPHSFMSSVMVSARLLYSAS